MSVYTTQDEICQHLGISRPTFQKYKEFLPIFGMDATPIKYASTQNILDFALENLRSWHKLPADVSFREICENFGIEGFAREAVYGLPRKKAVTIAFNNLKGGVAKTTTVANIAANLAALGQRVLMVDMDMQNQLSDHFGTGEIPPGLDSYYEGRSILQVIEGFAKEREVDVTLLKKTIVTLSISDKISIDLLPSEFDLDRGLVAAKGTASLFEFLLRDILDAVKDTYDFILIDTPPVSSTLLALSFYGSDFISFVVTPEKKSNDSFRYLLKQIKRLEKSARGSNMVIRPSSLVMTRCKADSASKTYAAVSDELAYFCESENIKHYRIEEREVVRDADMACQPLINHSARKEALGVDYELIRYAIDLVKNKH